MEHIDKEDKFSTGVYSRLNLSISKGEGAKLWDDEGNEYIDLNSGIGVAAVGHSNRKVKEAVNEQVDKLITSSPAYLYHENRAKLLEKLAEITPTGLTRGFLCNSGTEAIEASLKFARAFTGKQEIIATMRGFHGRTFGALSATWKKRFRRPFEPLVPGFHHVPFGQPKKIEEVISEKTAAVLLEPIQGEGGIHLPPEGYLSRVRQLCDETNTLLVFDEVQTGFARTGRMFACEHWNVKPDILALAKAMGGGVPIGAAVLKEEMEFSSGLHGSTFGGNPLAASAALATIEFIKDENLIATSRKKGEHFKEGLLEIKDKHPKKIREVRGLGLMLALQLRKKAGPYLNDLLEKNILALPAGSSVLRFLPPLVIEMEEIDQVLETLDKIIGSHD